MKIYTTYLPGFHEDSFNNKWWGKGFTEWNNVRSATPLFEGHIQPNIPLQGEYNAADPDILQAQFELAQSYGIDAFFIYGYWSLGKQPLSTPLQNIIDNPSLNVKYAYFWGNHSWTRSWTNRSGAKDVLLSQQYSDEDLYLFCAFLEKLFIDKRYETKNGRPIFIIYNPLDIPNLSSYIEKFRNYFKTNIHVDPYIIGCVTGWQKDYSYLDCFDTAMLFQPSFSLFAPEEVFTLKRKNIKDSISQITRAIPNKYKKILYPLLDSLPQKHKIYDYSQVADKASNQYKIFKKVIKNTIPMVCVGFDNTPRYNKRAKILEGFSIDSFEKNLKEARDNIRNRTDPMMVINAWNEWGEGMFLEPDIFYKLSKLNAVRQIKD